MQAMSHESSGLCWCGPDNHVPEQNFSSKLMLGVEPEPVWARRTQKSRTPKCRACGKFTSTLHPVWSQGWPTQEILWEVGNCCKEES